MAKVDPLNPMEIVKVTLMVAVGAFALRWISQRAGVAQGLAARLP
jgi:hypothetical protein